jgi:16S rRNA (guanine(966)-N(2))-methyltransferase RsmD
VRIYGNRQLKTLPGQNTRPTSARVREALFNIWQGKITGCSWLDLCAGNGSMGAEALCRGAAKVVGIEQSGQACHIIKQNWQQVAKSEQYFQVLRGDVLTKIKSLEGQQFDLIYFDPPYASNLYQPVLEAITLINLLTDTGEIAVEHNSKFWQAKNISNLKIYRQKTYGNTILTFYSLIQDV